MNCFQWQNHSSDYLDGTLPESVQSEADAHIKGCQECKDRFRHFRQLLSSISKQSQAELPSAFKKTPLFVTLPKAELISLGRSQWERVPWVFRTLVEGLGIVAVVLVGIASSPKIRFIYEKKMERSVKELTESFETPQVQSNPLEAKNQLPPFAHTVDFTSPIPEGMATDDQGPEEDEESAEVDQTNQVGNSQLWRFTVKTVSPDETRTLITKTLLDLHVASNTPGLEGLKVPGGIEFDLTLPQSIVLPLKAALEKLSPRSSEFSWYKVKSRTKIPDGKSQVVIWLVQPY